MTQNAATRELRMLTFTRLIAGIVLVGLATMLPAGTFRYWQAWAFMAVLFIPMIVFVWYLLQHNPQLLARRMRTQEPESNQRMIVKLNGIALLCTFILPGLDQRWSWSAVPWWVSVLADVVILLGYRLFMRTLRENEYAGRVVTVEAEQKLISSGPYAKVRHPMYLAALLIFCFVPLALDSYWALLPALLVAFSFIYRILAEEKTLRRDLPGYAEYCRQVRYRLIPGLW